MEIRSHSYQTAQTNRLVHDVACALDVHSSACYIRERDKRTETVLYGVADIDGVEVVVTGPHSTAQGVPAPTVREIAARMGTDRIMERLNRAISHRALIDATAAPAVGAELDERIARLRGLIS